MNAISDALIITKRQLLQLARVPELILFSIIQPIMFVLLFRFVFGGSIDTGQPGGYVQLLMPGIFVQTVAFTLASTAVGLTADMQKGLIDRFRSLPISRSAVVFGRNAAQWLCVGCYCNSPSGVCWPGISGSILLDICPWHVCCVHVCFCYVAC